MQDLQRGNIRIWIYVNGDSMPRRRACMQTAKSARAAYPIPLSTAEMLHLRNVRHQLRSNITFLRATIFIPIKARLIFITCICQMYTQRRVA